MTPKQTLQGKRTFQLTRVTTNYTVYEARVDEDKVGVVYIPTSVLRSPIPDEIDLIHSSRQVHDCNCKYCKRK